MHFYVYTVSQYCMKMTSAMNLHCTTRNTFNFMLIIPGIIWLFWLILSTTYCAWNYASIIDACLFVKSFQQVFFTAKFRLWIFVGSHLWPYFGKSTFLTQASFCKNRVENFYNFFKIIFLYIWIKQPLNLLAMKFHTKSFFLGDIYGWLHQADQVLKRGIKFSKIQSHLHYWATKWSQREWQKIDQVVLNYDH